MGRARISGTTAFVSSTKSRRAFAPAWLAGDPVARRLLAAGFERDIDRIDTARSAATRRVAGALIEELARQHGDLPQSAARDRHIEALSTGRAAAVVSGQQMGLFTGPAFTLYKAAGVVAAARALEAESGVPCVPIFWLQTEDHDWPEIDHCFVRGREGRPVRIAVESEPADARIPVAARRYGATVEDSLATFEAETSERPFGRDTAALLRKHYRPGASPAEALRGVFGEIFSDSGLLLFDPRTSCVAELARPIFERSLLEAQPFAEALAQRSIEIDEADFTVQVPVRRNAPLCFYHPDGAAGPRYRLEERDADWRLCDSDRTVSRDAVRSQLTADPLSVSSSALLRPLLQDYLLPTALYLGGPGEIAYFAQLAPLYEAFGIDMPLVAPRPSFCVTEAADRRRLEALGLGCDALAGDRDTLLNKLAQCTDGPDRDIAGTLTKNFLANLDSFAKRVLMIDPALAGAIDKTRSSVEHSVARLAQKYEQSIARRDTVTAGRLDALRDALAPNGVPQERCYGLASLTAQHGIDALVAAVMRTLEPFDGRTREIAF